MRAMSLLTDPVAFTCGPLAVRWYGLCGAAGFLAAAAHWAWRARRDGRPAAFGIDYALVVTVAGVLGGRLTYALAHAGDFLHRPADLFRFDRGGMVFLGGFLLAVAAVSLWGRRRGVGPLALLDFGVTALPLGHALGRLGCQLNGCCHGGPAAAPWGLPSPSGSCVPVALYEAGFNLLLYGFLNRVYGRHRPGAVFGLYLLGYGAWRFGIEFLRGDVRQSWGPLHVAQWLALALAIAGGALWLRRRGRAAA
jgi:phosphatidylglycerol:prolipoprotein diacylglycerol transferase